MEYSIPPVYSSCRISLHQTMPLRQVVAIERARACSVCPIVSSHPRKETVASRSSLSPSFLPPPSGHCPPPACLSALCLPLSSFSAIQLSSTAFLAHKGRPKRRRRAAAAKAKAAAAETSLRSTGTGEPSWGELRRQERLKEYQRRVD